MPLVNDDWRDPASWKTPSVSYAAVRDGDFLHFSRKTKSGKPLCFSCNLTEWNQNPDFRMKLEKDQAAGAWLAVGLEPHRVMIRRLDSPLKDKTKSAEIWETLLDAAIPFSIEKCRYTFLPNITETDKGLSCLAVASRLEDLENLTAEWLELGLTPDLTFPEELMLPKSHKYTLWAGTTRTIFTVFTSQGYLGGGGVVKRAQREKMLARFMQAREEDQEEIKWFECGPDSPENKNVLEESLAAAAFTSDSVNANLAGSEKLEKLHHKKTKTLKSALLLVGLLLLLAPLLLRHQLRVYQNSVRTQLSQTYEQLVGSKNNAPGQELLLARRFLDDKWGSLWDPFDKISEPQVSYQFILFSRAATQRGLVFSRVDLTESKVQFNLLGTESNVQNFMDFLQTSGWKSSMKAESNGTWRVSGEKPL